MGAATSHSEPSPPSSCGLVDTVSCTQLFAVTDYSRWARMPPGTALNFGSLRLAWQSYHLKVYPAGLDMDSADFVAVFVEQPFEDDHYTNSNRAPVRFSLEILDASRKHTVFDNSTARSEQTLRDHKRCKGYVRFVNRREMEASCCVREDDDSVTIRCTLWIDTEVAWPLILAPPPRDEVAEGAATAVGSRTVTIGGFSRFRAALRTGECAYTPHFALGGSSWYLKVYPNGHSDDSKDCVAVFLGRGKSDDPAAKAEFRFELVSGDCLVVRCHLRVRKVTTPSLMLPAAAAPTVTAPPCEISQSHGIGKTLTSPGFMAEMEDEQTSESDQTPLLANLHQR